MSFVQLKYDLIIKTFLFITLVVFILIVCASESVNSPSLICSNKTKT